MTTNPVNDLRQRTKQAMFAHAFFRLESALTIALTMLLAFFLGRPLPWWHWWYWLILGAVAEALIIYTSITDERTGEKVVSEMLRERYNPHEIKTQKYREKMQQALEYQDKIDEVITTMPPGVLRDHLAESTKGISDWIGSIFTIAQRLDVYERDELLHRDRMELPSGLAQLNRALAAEKDLAVRKQIEATLAAKKAQQGNLDALQNKMEAAQFRLEETLTALGTVYSQFQLMGAQKLNGSQATNLSGNIRDQVQGLQDILTSMNEVYGQP
jgi:hypothetical protein